LVETGEDRIPVYIRGGNIVPRKDRLRRSTVAMANDPYTIIVALDADGKASGDLYVDDGHSFDYKDQTYLQASFEYANNVLSYTPNHNQSGFDNSIERIVILGAENVSQITVISDTGKHDAGFYTWANGSIIVKLPGVGIEHEWKVRVA
jgi:alpha 1,3-glucosidase